MKRIDVRGIRSSKSLLSERIPSTTRLRVVGPYVTDQVGGFLLSQQDAVRQRSGWVAADFSKGTHDKSVGDPRDDAEKANPPYYTPDKTHFG